MCRRSVRRSVRTSTHPSRHCNRRAHTLAGRALVVAASRADTAAAILSAQRMDAHTAALGEPRKPIAAG